MIDVPLIGGVARWIGTRIWRRSEPGLSRRHDRQASILAEYKALYTRALAFLDAQATTCGLGDEARLKEAIEVRAQLRLLAPEPIRTQFRRVAELMDEWAKEARAGGPQPIAGGGAWLIGSDQTPHRARAEALWPGVRDEREKLADLLAADLALREARLG